ncbi:MAG: tRNA threonylcarbamoyladenosine dehydratase [Lachnospiraceae bacterium]|nr:tRNA threonylcarbamoyladenosine dehydratase [Lachnospiraceae bacterium]
MNTKEDRLSRLLPIFGEEALDKLNNSHVAVFGIGGVGGYVAEALVRGGIGEITIVDHDTVAASNLNRQIVALNSTIGMKKTEVMKARLLDINPELTIHARECFYLPETAGEFDFSEYDYVVDAVDTVTAKKEIIGRCKECNTPVISSMGTGNKTDPTLFKVSDIYSTKVCPLAKVMRHELKQMNIESLKVVYSEEEPKIKRATPASTSFVPGVAGLIIAGEVLKDLSYS